ncbi:putative premnaspirodiene oxygenase [Iris pallida]|uniref:Premnaspirodiene oxygenase n=1 Tax=Iris pallida TaxID=29817 RepID=A0AAX6IB91_IRIPA|nr:putative premnaspirodiene oxygenase [Iris pallida]
MSGLKEERKDVLLLVDVAVAEPKFRTSTAEPIKASCDREHAHLVGSVPHRRLRELSRRHGPLMLVRLGQVDFLVVSSPEAAEEVLKIHGTNFACRSKVGSVEFISYGYSDPFFCPYGRIQRVQRPRGSKCSSAANAPAGIVF